MKNPLTLALFSGLILVAYLFPQIVFSQNQPVGLMPVRIIINEGEPSLLTSTVWYTQVFGEGINQYEEKYYPVILEAIKEGWTEQSLNVHALKFEDLEKEVRPKEEAFYRQMVTNFPIYTVKNSRALIKPKNLPDPGAKAGPMANQFADILNCDLLVYVTIVGYHDKGKTQEENFPEEAVGNLRIAGMIIDGNTGEILEDVEVKLSKKDDPFRAGKKFKDKALKKLGLKFGKRLTRKIQKLQAGK